MPNQILCCITPSRKTGLTTLDRGYQSDCDWMNSLTNQTLRYIALEPMCFFFGVHHLFRQIRIVHIFFGEESALSGQDI